MLLLHVSPVVLKGRRQSTVEHRKITVAASKCHAPVLIANCELDGSLIARPHEFSREVGFNVWGEDPQTVL